MTGKMFFFLFVALFTVSFSLPGSERLLREYFPAGASYVMLFDVPVLAKAPLYAAMKNAGWELAKDSVGDLGSSLKGEPEKTVAAVMVAGIRKRSLSIVRTGKGHASITSRLRNIPSYVYPPKGTRNFRIYQGKVFFVPFAPDILLAARGKGRDYLHKYIDNLASRGKGHEPFLHEMRLFPKENVFFRAVAFSDGRLFSRIPGLQTCRKLTAYASLPGGERLYMQGRFQFEDAESPRFAAQMLRQYQILLTMLIASDDEALLGKLEKAFRYKTEGKVLQVEFAPDKALTRELIAVMAKQGTNMLLVGTDPKNLFRMPSGRNKRKE